MKMTAEQVCGTYGYALSSLKRNFPTVARSIKNKYGVELIKCKNGEGKEFYEVTSPRAITIFEEIKDEIYVPIDTIKMSDLACFTLIGIAATPQGVFRGTYKDFLDYIGLSHTKHNIELLKEVLNKFKTYGKESPLQYTIDKDIIVLYLDRSFEKKQILTIEMLRECQRIAKKHSQRNQGMKVVQLLKVWQVYRINEQNHGGLITDREIQEQTNLSKHQVTEIKKLLQEENIIYINKVIKDNICYGSDVDINAFVDNKMQVTEE